MFRAVIIANGVLPDLEKARALLRADDVILCADGGLMHAQALGLKPDKVIGDMDSLSKQYLNELTKSNGEVILYPADKNKTDLELAMEHAVELGVDEILVMAALGNRLDQTLSNIGLLMGDEPSTKDVRLDDGVEEVFFCKDHAQINGSRGDTVSLIPWGGLVGGINTEGLKWPLMNDSLFVESSRGISNSMLTETASVSITFGLLLIVHRRLGTPAL